MRCVCCNKVLTDYEATRRSIISGAFLDMCNRCIVGLGIGFTDRPDLLPQNTQEVYYEDDMGDVYLDTTFPVIRPDGEEE